jgi:hypothetical protein
MQPHGHSIHFQLMIEEGGVSMNQIFDGLNPGNYC